MRFPLLCLLALFAAPFSLAQLLPAQTAGASAIEDALRHGELASRKQLSRDVGINRPHKLSLLHDGTELACLWKNPDRKVEGQLDHWRYEIAAYRMDRLLGMGMVPPTVARSLDGEEGSCQLWIDSVRTVWVISQEAGAEIPGDKALNWQRRLWLREAFDNLIGNNDRNQGNVLVTADWRLILSDHSRAFCPHRTLTTKLLYEGPDVQRRLPRHFVARLRTLDAATIREAVGSSLTEREIRGLRKRCRLLLRAINRMIAEFGEDDVLYG